MSDCIFCAIVARTAPAEIVYEDDAAVAFLDLAQATEGHTLVVPRAHHVDMFDIPHEAAADVMHAAVEVGRLLRARLELQGVNIVHASGPTAWQSVFHFHLHVVPRYRIDELRPPWPIGRVVEREVLARVAEKIRG